MRFDILSLFPEMFSSPFEHSIIKRAIEKSLVQIEIHNIRDYATDKHKTTDDAPYGGGGGMVMKVEPIAGALSAIKGDYENSLTVLLAPQGECFNQSLAKEFSTYSRIILICGRYEGVDERVTAHLVDREVSIGDYVLTGGELPAMVFVDAVSRLVEGVVGNDNAVDNDSFATGLLEYPHYARPANYNDWQVPEILLSGHQKNVNLWRRQESLRKTKLKRPELLASASLSAEDKQFLKSLE